jgi:hypothetical protein
MDGAALPWLLEPENPSARYLALTGLLERPADDEQLAAARAAIPGWGVARAILDAQWPEGYWMRPGVGYSPRHKATTWQVIFLAALGSPRTEAIDRACAYVLDHSRLPDGRFSAHKTARGAIACLNGNLLRAYLQLGYEDPRLEESLEALARMVLRDRFCCRFHAKIPLPAKMGDGLPCAWGAVKALGALAGVPEARRSAAEVEAIQVGIEFLLSGDLARGVFPQGAEPSARWHEFGFPPDGSCDLLEALEVLAQLGVARNPQIASGAEIVRSKRDAAGRWWLEHGTKNTWGSFGRVGRANKWVTIRALQVLQSWR